MQKTRPPMSLSRDEEVFLRQWMHDEVHFMDRLGPAKRLQLEHRAAPADLATLIAAAIPDPLQQEAAAHASLPDEPPIWPWRSEDALRSRIEEARRALSPDTKSRAERTSS